MRVISWRPPYAPNATIRGQLHLRGLDQLVRLDSRVVVALGLPPHQDQPKVPKGGRHYPDRLQPGDSLLRIRVIIGPSPSTRRLNRLRGVGVGFMACMARSCPSSTR